MMGRRELREQIFMLLFRVEFHEGEDLERQERIYEDWKCDPAAEDEVPLSESDMEYILGKYRGVLDHMEHIDLLLRDSTEKWRLGRIGKTELTILRLALYEMLYDTNIPVGVAINEAVELAKKFCQDGAGGFVNGILARFAKEGATGQGQGLTGDEALEDNGLDKDQGEKGETPAFCPEDIRPQPRKKKSRISIVMEPAHSQLSRDEGTQKA